MSLNEFWVPSKPHAEDLCLPAKALRSVRHREHRRAQANTREHHPPPPPPPPKAAQQRRDERSERWSSTLIQVLGCKWLPRGPPGPADAQSPGEQGRGPPSPRRAGRQATRAGRPVARATRTAAPAARRSARQGAIAPEAAPPLQQPRKFSGSRPFVLECLEPCHPRGLIAADGQAPLSGPAACRIEQAGRRTRRETSRTDKVRARRPPVACASPPLPFLPSLPCMQSCVPRQSRARARARASCPVQPGRRCRCVLPQPVSTTRIFEVLSDTLFSPSHEPVRWVSRHCVQRQCTIARSPHRCV